MHPLDPIRAKLTKIKSTFIFLNIKLQRKLIKLAICPLRLLCEAFRRFLNSLSSFSLQIQENRNFPHSDLKWPQRPVESEVIWSKSRLLSNFGPQDKPWKVLSSLKYHMSANGLGGQGGRGGWPYISHHLWCNRLRLGLRLHSKVHWTNLD